MPNPASTLMKLREGVSALCPPGTRLVNLINHHFAEFPEQLKQVSFPDALVLSSHGLARSLSPKRSNMSEGEICKSHRLANQGVLHNPINDKRTTEGSFHVSEGGITADKYRMPKQVFLNMLVQVLQPPKKLNVVPYTSETTSESDWTFAVGSSFDKCKKKDLGLSESGYPSATRTRRSVAGEPSPSHATTTA